MRKRRGPAHRGRPQSQPQVGAAWLADAPERYELTEKHRSGIDRREFFRRCGGGVVVVMLLNDLLPAQESGGGRRSFDPEMPQAIGAWLHVGSDEKITVYTGKVEVGQDIRTSLSQVVAEELHVPLTQISMVMGDTDRTPFDRGTFGSRTTPVMAPQLRLAAAAARALLVDLAAERWQTAASSLEVVDGSVSRPQTGETLSFAELTQGRQLVEIIGDEQPTSKPQHWTLAGRPARKVVGRTFVSGRHRYPSDSSVDGMAYGKVLRPVAFGATLSSLDAAAAAVMPGVTVVQEGDFVGVVAPSEAVASEAIASMTARWNRPPQPSASQLYDDLRKPEDPKTAPSRPSVERVGSVEQGLAEADHRLRESYRVAYIAHAPLEPRAALAHWIDGRLTVWTGTQRPFGVQSELAEAFDLPEQRIRVIVPDTGSGYGGKHTGEAAVEAARLARAAGNPVKLVWTREEEFTWAYFRPAGVIDVHSGVCRDGKLTAWEFHNYNSGTSAIRPMYEIPHQRLEFHRTSAPLRQGSYRALAATANHFARETHLDELAKLLALDAVEFRLQNLRDSRLRAVLTAAAAEFGWGRASLPAGHGIGVAAGFEKGSYLATCAEVAVDRQRGSIEIIRIVQAFECGTIINPDNLRNQVVGSIIMGLGGALFETIDFDDGRILNPAFSKYRVPRFSDVPRIDVVLLDRKDLPSAGAGETPIVGIAPAIGNAIFDATGVRLRSLPLVPAPLRLGAEEADRVLVAELDDLPPGSTAKVDLGEQSVLLLNDAGEVKAFSVYCTHESCEVEWRQNLGQLQCPCHGGRFDADGRVLSGPPPGALPQYEVTVDNGHIYIVEG